LQPLIQASGFTIGEYTGNTDLRVILFSDKIIQSYLRIAKAGDFRANAQQGGKIMYLKLKQIPADVLKMTKGITKLLPVKTAFYALDFIKSNNGNLYFIEGNNRPGLNWYDNEDKKRAKQLIRLLVKDLQQLI
ncbi:MAG: ribosomal protein S6 modification enzyme, partial [uncultured bacterium]